MEKWKHIKLMAATTKAEACMEKSTQTKMMAATTKAEAHRDKHEKREKSYSFYLIKIKKKF
jgi:hypothetical protein